MSEPITNVPVGPESAELDQLRSSLREACDQIASLESDLGGATARVAELEDTVRRLNTQHGDVALLIERERGFGQDCVDSGDVEAALSLEDPHDSPLHRSYKVAHDLPPIGGATC